MPLVIAFPSYEDKLDIFQLDLSSHEHFMKDAPGPFQFLRLRSCESTFEAVVASSMDGFQAQSSSHDGMSLTGRDIKTRSTQIGRNN